MASSLCHSLVRNTFIELLLKRKYFHCYFFAIISYLFFAIVMMRTPPPLNYLRVLLTLTELCGTFPNGTATLTYPFATFRKVCGTFPEGSGTLTYPIGTLHTPLLTLTEVCGTFPGPWGILRRPQEIPPHTNFFFKIF